MNSNKISFGRCRYCKEFTKLTNGICGRVRCNLTKLDTRRPLTVKGVVSYLTKKMKIKKLRKYLTNKKEFSIVKFMITYLCQGCKWKERCKKTEEKQFKCKEIVENIQKLTEEEIFFEKK